MAAQANGHYTPAAGSMTRTSSFAPITPVVKERVGDVALRLSEVGKIIDDINVQSATNVVRSPTMGDLQQEIDLLKKDIEATRLAQQKQINDIRNDVKNNVKEEITKSMQSNIEKKIMESIKAQVKIEVAEWGGSAAAKKLVESLKTIAEGNDVLIQEAQLRLDNSRSRHENSTLDEHADFETNLSQIKLSNGKVSEAFPRSLKVLFSYDEHQLLQLFDEYGLRRLNTHLENLNRFLAFIGLRFSVPEQSLDFSGEPPAYQSPNVLDPPIEENPPSILPVSPPDQGKNRTKPMPEANQERENPPQEPAPANDNSVQVPQEERPDENWTEERHSMQQDHGGQRAGSAFPRRAIVATNRPQQSTGHTQPVRSGSFNRGPPPRPPQPPSPQENKAGVTGWFKSLADGF